MDSPFRPVQAARGRPRVPQGHCRAARCPLGTVQRQAWHLPAFTHRTRKPGGTASRRPDPTQFGRALEELDIRLILAHTPQAKGRVERVWGTFQDRLVSEMRLADATTIEQANQVLWDFIPRYNQRFGVPPAQQGSAYRQLSAGVSLNEPLCFKYVHTVANDNTLQFNGDTMKILPDHHRASYARAHVEVQERLDGSIVVMYRGKTLDSRSAPEGPFTLRARNGRRSNGRMAHGKPVIISSGAHPLQRPRTGPRTSQHPTTLGGGSY